MARGTASNVSVPVAGATTAADLRLLNPHLWSTTEPYLYTVQTRVTNASGGGAVLDGLYFAAPKAAAGQRAPVVLNNGGADAILLSGSSNQGAPYTSRGISFINVDGPGQGGSLRLKNLYAPPDSERYARAVVDYLVTPT